MEQRGTRDVIEDHIRCRKAADLEADLDRNYAPDVVLLSSEGIHRGHAGVRELAEILRTYLPDGRYEIQAVHVDGEYGLELWNGAAPGRQAHDGADSFVVRGGVIVAQTIHYSVDGAADGD